MLEKFRTVLASSYAMVAQVEAATPLVDALTEHWRLDIRSSGRGSHTFTFYLTDTSMSVVITRKGVISQVWWRKTSADGTRLDKTQVLERPHEQYGEYWTDNCDLVYGAEKPRQKDWPEFVLNWILRRNEETPAVVALQHRIDLARDGLNYQRGRLAKAQADLDRIAKQVAESEEELGQLDTQLITLQAQAVDIPQ
jgi:hypothetical protein